MKVPEAHNIPPDPEPVIIPDSKVEITKIVIEKEDQPKKKKITVKKTDSPEVKPFKKYTMTELKKFLVAKDRGKGRSKMKKAELIARIEENDFTPEQMHNFFMAITDVEVKDIIRASGMKISDSNSLIDQDLREPFKSWFEDYAGAIHDDPHEWWLTLTEYERRVLYGQFLLIASGSQTDGSKKEKKLFDSGSRINRIDSPEDFRDHTLLIDIVREITRPKSKRSQNLEFALRCFLEYVKAKLIYLEEHCKHEIEKLTGKIRELYEKVDKLTNDIIDTDISTLNEYELIILFERLRNTMHEKAPFLFHIFPQVDKKFLDELSFVEDSDSKKEVPFYVSKRDNYCTVACLQMMMRYYDLPFKDQDDMKPVCQWFEVCVVDSAADEHFIKIKLFEVKDLKRVLEHDPVIVRIDFPTRAHSIVLTSSDDGTFYYHDPAYKDGANRTILEADLDKRWFTSDRSCIIYKHSDSAMTNINERLPDASREDVLEWSNDELNWFWDHNPAVKNFIGDMSDEVFYNENIDYKRGMINGSINYLEKGGTPLNYQEDKKEPKLTIENYITDLPSYHNFYYYNKMVEDPRWTYIKRQTVKIGTFEKSGFHTINILSLVVAVQFNIEVYYIVTDDGPRTLIRAIGSLSREEFKKIGPEGIEQFKEGILDFVKDVLFIKDVDWKFLDYKFIAARTLKLRWFVDGNIFKGELDVSEFITLLKLFFEAIDKSTTNPNYLAHVCGKFPFLYEGPSDWPDEFVVTLTGLAIGLELPDIDRVGLDYIYFAEGNKIKIGKLITNAERKGIIKPKIIFPVLQVLKWDQETRTRKLQSTTIRDYYSQKKIEMIPKNLILVISQDPSDIIFKSTSQFWEQYNCERVVGGEYGGVRKKSGWYSDIENNNAIAYVVEDKGADTIWGSWLGRIELKWCIVLESKIKLKDYIQEKTGIKEGLYVTDYEGNSIMGIGNGFIPISVIMAELLLRWDRNELLITNKTDLVSNIDHILTDVLSKYSYNKNLDLIDWDWKIDMSGVEVNFKSKEEGSFDLEEYIKEKLELHSEYQLRSEDGEIMGLSQDTLPLSQIIKKIKESPWTEDRIKNLDTETLLTVVENVITDIVDGLLTELEDLSLRLAEWHFSGDTIYIEIE